MSYKWSQQCCSDRASWGHSNEWELKVPSVSCVCVLVIGLLAVTLQSLKLFSPGPLDPGRWQKASSWEKSSAKTFGLWRYVCGLHTCILQETITFPGIYRSLTASSFWQTMAGAPSHPSAGWGPNLPGHGKQTGFSVRPHGNWILYYLAVFLCGHMLFRGVQIVGKDFFFYEKSDQY